VIAARRPYVDATWAGLALGVVLLLSFVLAGRGLGASGAFAAVAGRTIDAVAPNATAGDPRLADRLPAGESTPLTDNWIVLEIVGVCIGAALSAWWSGRWRVQPSLVSRPRIVRAVAGGALMGLGARLAYGCTSGLALSGGALLATGAWIFIPIAFGTAFLVTWLAREWALEVAQ
jgi:uncharacterized membrane protein YedE/YeeE